MSATATKLPPDPRTIAEMIPVREAEIAARKAPLCTQNKSHGRMVPRDLASQTYEQMYCGVWYECRIHGCSGNCHWLSRELAAYHGEPYVVDDEHWERWDGGEWVAVTKTEFDAYWAERAKRYQMSEAQHKARTRRSRSAAHRQALGVPRR